MSRFTDCSIRSVLTAICAATLVACGGGGSTRTPAANNPSGGVVGGTDSNSGAGTGSGSTSGTGVDNGSGTGSGTTGGDTTPVTLLGLAISPGTVVLSYGDTLQLTAFDRYSDGSNVVRTDVTWTSSDATVASISNDVGSKGVVTGGVAGTATVTATDFDGGRTSSVTVVVTEAVLQSLAITPATSSTPAGYGVQYTVTAKYSDMTSADEPVDVTDLATWSSSNEAVATVSNDPITAGLATGVAPGEATVTATLPGGMSASASIAVTAAVLETIAITSPTANLPKGVPTQLTAKATFSDATTQDVTGFVTWSSSDPAVASVSNLEGSAGVVTGAAEGTVTITAMHANVQAQVTVTVTSATLSGVAISATPSRPWTWRGTTTRFNAVGTFVDGTVLDVSRAMNWTVSPAAVATWSTHPGKSNIALATTATTDPVVITGTDPVTGATGSFTWARIRARNR